MELSNSEDRFSPRVSDFLHKAGWFTGRDVLQSLSLPTNFNLFLKAEEVLKEFGNLEFGECESGIDCATSDVHIDPELGAHFKEELEEYEQSLKTKLYPLGEIHRGHAFLVIDEQGRTYLLMDELTPYAPSFSRALEMLLHGKKADPGEIEKAWE